jgi:E3 ubiquitin-protein ligase RBBP6
MSVRFKFKNDLDFSAVPCDGFHISVRDLKRAIIRMKRLGRVTDFDLDVVNQQDGKAFDDEATLIAKNSTLIIVRRPLPSGTQKLWEDDKLPSSAGSAAGVGAGTGLGGQSGGFLTSSGGAVELSEEDKINEAINNSTEIYGQKYWVKYRGKAGGGQPPPTYRCTKCHQPGHWKDDCVLAKSGYLGGELKKTTGIPRSFLKPAHKDTPGAKINPQGNCISASVLGS